MATRTARRAGGRIHNGVGGLWPGVHDSTFHAKEEVHRGRPLEMADDKGRPAGDRVGVLHPLKVQAKNI